MIAPIYLSPERSGVRWLLDPASPPLAPLARELESRTEVTPCESASVAADLLALPALIRDRHFGLASGLVPVQAGAEAEALIDAARQRILATQPTSWGRALGDLNDGLRLCLHDRHIRLQGSRPSAIRSAEPTTAVDPSAPAVEVQEQHGVLCVIVRRLWGGPEDDRLLRDWARNGLRHFQYDRIVVDLRGNSGGNDTIAYEWMRPAIPAGANIPGTSTGWFVGDAPLNIWNVAALIEARDGIDAVPGWLGAGRHIPAEDDDLELRTETAEPLEAGISPWHGRLLVLVDGGTRSAGESSAWMLRHALGGRLAGGRTAGMIEFGNIAPYLLPASGLHIGLATQHNDFGQPVELIGLPVDAELDPAVPISAVAADFDLLYGRSG